MAKLCSDLQKQYFQQHGKTPREITWGEMEWPCRIKTWFGHKYRRATRLFSKIKVGDFVYDSSNPPRIGQVKKLESGRVYFHNPSERVPYDAPRANVKKMTVEQGTANNISTIPAEIADFLGGRKTRKQYISRTYGRTKCL